MRPGILIQHGTLPQRARELVRCDVAGVVGFIPREEWPPEATAGDLVHLRLRRWVELAEHPQRQLVEPIARRAVRSFFENGGEECQVFAVCIESEADLLSASQSDGPLVALFERLRGEEDLALLCVPRLGYLRCDVTRSGKVVWHGETLANELLAHCRSMTNRFLILDAPRGLHGDLLEGWFADFRAREPLNRAYGAVYYPWLMRGDELFAPSGAIMGLFARAERSQYPTGIARPPANLPIHGATHTEVEMGWGEVGAVSDAGVNPLVVQPGRGVVVWGARTMSTDPAWTFINSRRIVSMVTEQLRRDNEWAVFEPNEGGLWKVIERDVLVRLEQFWSAGLLSGARAMEEYSVECNSSTNPLDVRDRGELHVQVQLKPVGTTERILIDLRLGSPET